MSEGTILFITEYRIMKSIYEEDMWRNPLVDTFWVTKAHSLINIKNMTHSNIGHTFERVSTLDVDYDASTLYPKKKSERNCIQTYFGGRRWIRTIEA